MSICPNNYPQHAERCSCLPPLGPSVHEVAEINRSIANNLAHEAGVMKARLDLLRAGGEAVLAWWDDMAPEQRFSLPQHMGIALAVNHVRRAVDRAALPIESPEVLP